MPPTLALLVQREADIQAFRSKPFYVPEITCGGFTASGEKLSGEGVNADLRHYIPTLARRSRCFPRKLENLQSILTVFVRAYNRFGAQKSRYLSRQPGAAVLFSLLYFL